MKKLLVTLTIIAIAINTHNAQAMQQKINLVKRAMVSIRPYSTFEYDTKKDTYRVTELDDPTIELIKLEKDRELKILFKEYRKPEVFHITVIRKKNGKLKRALDNLVKKIKNFHKMIAGKEQQKAKKAFPIGRFREQRQQKEYERKEQKIFDAYEENKISHEEAEKKLEKLAEKYGITSEKAKDFELQKEFEKSKVKVKEGLKQYMQYKLK